MKNKIAFWVSFICSISLIIGGFFVPPTGVIDGSVLTAVGELFAFGCLFELPPMLNNSKKLKLKKGDTELEIHKEDTEDEVLYN